VAENAVFLKALTPEARGALGGSTLLITRFPFRVGRESRLGENVVTFPGSRRRTDTQPNNELYLVDPGTILNVSREHFLIDVNEHGYFLVDRGSACGTLVEGDLVGERKKGGTRQLHDHDVIIVGTSESRYVFKFLITGAP
jgi:pSer/pThr/pTyr-binding forkhead associated (FHA) protein